MTIIKNTDLNQDKVEESFLVPDQSSSTVIKAPFIDRSDPVIIGRRDPLQDFEQSVNANQLLDSDTQENVLIPETDSVGELNSTFDDTYNVDSEDFSETNMSDESSLDDFNTHEDIVENKPAPPIVPQIDEAKIREEYDAKYKDFFDDLLRAADGLKDARDQVIKDAQDNLLKLSMTIAEKVINKVIEKDDTIIQEVIEDTLTKIAGADRIIFKINPGDVPIFEKIKPHIESRLIGVQKITIQPDATIDQGGAIIETDLGFVDVSIREKLNIISKAFQKIELT